jgi:hypothetical protein
MDDIKLKRTFDMDDVKNSNRRMDLDNFGDKMNFKDDQKSKKIKKNIINNLDNNNKGGNQQNLNSKNKDELLNISDSS